MKNIKKKLKNQKGAAMLTSVIFFLFISLAIIAGLVSPSVRAYKIVSADFNSKNSYFLAESGVEDAYYRIVNNIPIGSTEILNLEGNSTTTTITDSGINQKEINSLGDSFGNQRKVSIVLSTSPGVSFNYGVQVGQGGLLLVGSSGIVGNVYANGPIIGSGSSYITGTAISGNSPAGEANQINGTGTPSHHISFGNNNSTQDVAQSFQVSTSSPLNKVSFYIKKVGSPSNATATILNNSGGLPGSSVLATGILSSSTVTSNYGWVDVSFSSNPLLTAGTTYWLVIDASTSSSKYYVIGASGNDYQNGLAMIGRLGSNWVGTVLANNDYFFKIYLGGINGLIAGSSDSQWNQFKVGTSGSGSAQAHTVNYTNATGDIYCKVGTGNNKLCQDQEDPPYIAYPISDANITKWKSDASLGNTHSGNYSTPTYASSTLGPKHITGDLNVSGSHTLYLTGTVWVEGNVNVTGSGKIVLHSSYGNTSGILVSDGRLILSGSGQLNGTGQTGSYILFVTTSNCDASFCAGNAINISGNAGSVILNAQNGTISFTGSASAKEATAYKMSLSGNTIVNYESGLANLNFTSGPSGSWGLENWQEVE